MRGGSEGTDIDKGLRRIQNYSYALVVIASVIFAAGIAAVYAVLFPVFISDTVSIIDDPSLRTTTKDSLDPQEAPSNSQSTTDSVGPLDAVSPSISVVDTLGLSDSAVVTASMFYQVTTTSILTISDSASLDTPILDTANVQDSLGITAAVIDLLSLLDSAVRVLALSITDSLAISDSAETQVQKAGVDEEVEEEDNDGGGGGPDRTVYDESYFEDRPLSRLEVARVELVDSEDRVMTRVLSGQNIDISIAMQNHQKSSQSFTLFIQITDQDNVALAIIQTTGTIKDGATIKVEVPWTTSSPGEYNIQIVTCDGNLSPTIISESVSKAVVVG